MQGDYVRVHPQHPGVFTLQCTLYSVLAKVGIQCMWGPGVLVPRNIERLVITEVGQIVALSQYEVMHAPLPHAVLPD